MTLFELVRQTLDKLHASCVFVYGDAATADAQIGARLAYLSQSYGDLHKQGGPAIQYADPATRFAYVFRYVASHGDFVNQILRLLRAQIQRPVFHAPHAQIACLGGGPGSDLIGVLKYLESMPDEPVQELQCWQLDNEQNWQEAWAGVNAQLNAKTRFHSFYMTLDATNRMSWGALSAYFQADLFTFSYFISEIMKFNGNGAVADFLGHIFKHAKPGALFLFDDNSSGGFVEFFDAACAAAGLARIIGSDGVRWWPDQSERREELRAYVDRYGQNPKVQAWLSYRVYRKP